MKHLAVLAVQVLFLPSLFGSVIGVGVHTEAIALWRYWENTEIGYEYKMLVINTSDSSLTFKVDRVVFKGIQLIEDTSQARSIVAPHVLEKGQMAIYTLPASLNSHEFMKFFVNGKSVGVLDFIEEKPPKNRAFKRFVYHEGLNGLGSFDGWISKNQLLADFNQPDTLFLHINCFEESLFDHEGLYLIQLSPTLNFDYLSVRHHDSTLGEFSVWNKYYTLSFPVRPKQDQDRCYELAVIYEVKPGNKNISVGLSCASGMNRLREGETWQELQKKLRPDSRCILPVFVRSGE